MNLRKKWIGQDKTMLVFRNHQNFYTRREISSFIRYPVLICIFIRSVAIFLSLYVNIAWACAKSNLQTLSPRRSVVNQSRIIV